MKKIHVLEVKQKASFLGFFLAEDKYLLLCPDRAAQHLIKCLFNWLGSLYTFKTLFQGSPDVLHLKALVTCICLGSILAYMSLPNPYFLFLSKLVIRFLIIFLLMTPSRLLTKGSQLLS